ncbi:amino acid ABC transporter permease [uncultured Enterovirga sp.]|uniref:amino acid ABC transporter permease n=1 Tax=uncultured Enterovirga sp. TaxID=2026352 RepID=UPI0035CA226D
MNWDLVFTANNLRRLLVGDFPPVLGGLALTLTLAILGIVASTVIGFAVGYARFAGNRPVRWLAAGYVEFLRNVPLLILIFWAYFVPPYFGFSPSKFGSVLVALVLFNAAYIAEVLRGGLLSVPAGQIEAARAIGMSQAQQVLYVVLPIAAYNVIPALTGRYITLVKNTSLAFLIGLAELTEIGRQINNRLLTAPIEVYALLLGAYFILNCSLSFGMRRFEDRGRFNRSFCFFAR